MTEEQPESEALKTMLGEHGHEAQFAAVSARTTELINQRFDLISIMGGPGVQVHGPTEPFIFTR